MSERITGHKIEWKNVEVSPGHFIQSKKISPEILAKMPTNSRTFIQVGPIEFFVRETKKLLKGQPNNLFP